MAWALLPLKDLVRAKGRLSGLLAPHERRALAQAMVEDALGVLAAHSRLEGVLLVSDDPGAELLARKYTLACISERTLQCEGLNGAVQAATTYLLREHRAGDIMVLHGDIPLLQDRDISELLDNYESPEVDLVIAPDLAGSGTNVMLFEAARAPGFSYGVGSCQAHQALARAAGLRVAVVDNPRLGLDVDSPADLLALYHALRDGAPATHTAAVLLDSAVEQRLRVMERNGLGEPGGENSYDAM